jgi:hypothetical protein
MADETQDLVAELLAERGLELFDPGAAWLHSYFDLDQEQRALHLGSLRNALVAGIPEAQVIMHAIEWHFVRILRALAVPGEA